tara:strand:+ start:166 stop:519 length:354 start_codon:yes stop_codon:yes gene_type:complete
MPDERVEIGPADAGDLDMTDPLTRAHAELAAGAPLTVERAMVAFPMTAHEITINPQPDAKRLARLAARLTRLKAAIEDPANAAANMVPHKLEFNRLLAEYQGLHPIIVAEEAAKSAS